MTKHAFISSSIGFSCGLLIAACTSMVPNPEHCRYANGDDTCVQLYGAERSFCTSADCDQDSEGNYGCVAEPPADDCYYPCGDDMTLAQDDSCIEISDDTDTETDTETDTSTDTSTDTGPQPCMGPQDCNPEAPFCDDDSGECVTCDGVMDPDAACAEVDAGAPLCIEGTCVQCTEEDDAACGDLTPLCDVGANTCIGCSGHEQCPESACNLAEGNCFGPDNVVHVDGDDPCDSGDGSEESPYCSLTEALLGASDDPVIIVHEVGGDPLIYLESNTISFSTAIFAASGESPVVRGSVAAALTVSSSGRLFLRGISIDNTADGHVGLSITGGQAWIEQSRIVNNSGGGIIVDGGGSLFIQNSFVGGSNSAPAIDLQDGDISVLYSTLGLPPSLGGPALSCNDGSSSTLRNSLVTSTHADPEIQCPQLTVSNSAFESMNDDINDSGGNMLLGELDLSWFVDYLAGDFTLTGDHPEELDTTAVWQSGDPATDINGDSRPTTDGMADFAGADRFP